MIGFASSVTHPEIEIVHLTDTIRYQYYISECQNIQEHLEREGTKRVSDYSLTQLPNHHDDNQPNNILKGSSNKNTPNNQSSGKYNRYKYLLFQFLYRNGLFNLITTMVMSKV